MSSVKLRKRARVKRLRSSIRPRWAVLISGRGSNLGALLNLAADQQAEIVGVFSSSDSAYGMKRARRRGFRCEVIPRAGKKLDYLLLTRRLRELQVDHLFLAGYMRLLPADFVKDWSGRIVNLHPSLLPQYPGLESIRRAYDEAADIGCTVHIVVPEVDAGPLILQHRVFESAKVSKMKYDQVEQRVHLREQLSVCRVMERWNSRYLSAHSD